MSYYRPIRVDELVAWLLEREYVNEYDVDALAADLVDAFDMLFESKTAT